MTTAQSTQYFIDTWMLDIYDLYLQHDNNHKTVMKQSENYL